MDRRGPGRGFLISRGEGRLYFARSDEAIVGKFDANRVWPSQ